MTILELHKAGVRRIRRKEWNDSAYLQLPESDFFWMDLYDPRSQIPNSWKCPQKVNILGFPLDSDGWLEFKGEVYDEEKARKNAPVCEVSVEAIRGPL